MKNKYFTLLTQILVIVLSFSVAVRLTATVSSANDASVEKIDLTDEGGGPISDHETIIAMLRTFIRENRLADAVVCEDSLSGTVVISYYYIHPEQQKEFESFIREHNIDANEVTVLVMENAAEPQSDDTSVRSELDGPGDVNMDGKVNSSDARLALRASAKLEELTADQRRSADVDEDGKVTSIDARTILRIAAKIESVPKRDRTDPIDSDPSRDHSGLDAVIGPVLHEKYRSEIPDGLLHFQSWRLLAEDNRTETPDGKITVYLIVCHKTYSVNEGLQEVSGGIVPAAIAFSIDGTGAYFLEEYWTPQTGIAYESDLRAKFPAEAAEEALNVEKYSDALDRDILDQAAAYLKDLMKR